MQKMFYIFDTVQSFKHYISIIIICLRFSALMKIRDIHSINLCTLLKALLFGLEPINCLKCRSRCFAVMGSSLLFSCGCIYPSCYTHSLPCSFTGLINLSALVMSQMHNLRLKLTTPASQHPRCLSTMGAER